ncbi:hypothetical protein LCL61_21985 [Amycolatopsis coloradensis]|uniref:Uncharacterized protein n=1 Tax=Amycolatopsis coloradensis TaxID=76021 RepID=A0ACD5BG32_9PSEU
MIVGAGLAGLPAGPHLHRAVPVFREASGDRQMLCAVQNRCSNCGMSTGDENLWHVVGALRR